MAYCRHCGAEVRSSDTFCYTCGNALEIQPESRTPGVGIESPRASGAYQAILSELMSGWWHQNGLLWGRTQLLTITQGAVLAGAFATIEKHREISILLLLFGAIITSAMLRIIFLDRKYRNQLGPFINWLASRVIEPFKEEVANATSTKKSGLITDYFPLMDPPGTKFSGKIMLNLLFALYLITDVILAVLIFRQVI